MQMSKQPPKSFPQPLDRAAIVLMLVLSLLIGLLLWHGSCSSGQFCIHTGPRVRDFSWQNKRVGAEETSFFLTFTRPMDQASVENNLQIAPPLPGKVSWAGRRMAYTLRFPAPYGTSFTLRLQGARDRFVEEEANRALIQPFTGNFQTRDRAFVYLGVEGEESGRIILYNLTQQQKSVLTPNDLVVMDFRSYPEGDRLLFSATSRSTQGQSLPEQQLYTVTTGIHSQASGSGVPKKAEPAGKIALVLDNKDYQNLKFDLSADGQTIVVQRANRRNPGQFGIWMIKSNQEPKPLNNQPGGDFLITPDSGSLAIAQGQGLAILPLEPQAQPLDFLPKFGTVLSFAGDGSAAAMVKFNTDYTRSLFLVTNQGIQKELLRTTGSILNAQFDPLKQTLYCLLTQLMPGKTYQEQPYLAAVDLKGGKLKPLLLLPNQRDVQMSLAPDGLALLFDQAIAATTEGKAQADNPRTSEGRAIATSRLWLLPLPPEPEASTKVQPEPLPLAGLRPRWLP